MSRFTGKQHKGAMRERRAQMKAEAQARNAATEPTNRRRYRLAQAKADKAQAA